VAVQSTRHCKKIGILLLSFKKLQLLVELQTHLFVCERKQQHSARSHPLYCYWLQFTFTIYCGL